MHLGEETELSPMKHTHTYRFWIWHHKGWVKLSIVQGQELNTCRGWYNGEGWSYQASQYTIEIIGKRKCLIERWENGGKDCDGKHEEHGSRICSVRDLRALDANDNYIARGRMSHGREIMVRDGCYWEGRPIQHPNFEKFGKTRVYDQYAQMMNY